MLFVHGYSAPLRLMEEVRYWKTQERENAALLRSAIEGLDQETIEWLRRWESAFAASEAAAHQWMEDAVLSGTRKSLSDSDGDRLEALLSAAAAQSQQWVASLLHLAGTADDARGGNGRKETILHMARDSEYFLSVLNGNGVRRAQSNEGPPLLAEGLWSGAQSPQEAVPIGGHRLPPLPYAYDALEPHLDAETIRIHHDILHKNYVDGLNKAELKLAEARRTGDFDLVKHWERELAFNGAGHYSHTIYFFGMSPNGGGRPGGELAAQINKDFGSFEAFHQHFSKAAEKVEGGGWAHLVWSPRSHRLEILQAEKHQNLSQWDVVPLLSLDVWEHSYYLLYKNERAKYIDAWFNLVYWDYASDRYLAAKKLKWTPY